MGTVGDALDNPVADNFFAPLKTELLGRYTWRTVARLKRRPSSNTLKASRATGVVTQPSDAQVPWITKGGGLTKSESASSLGSPSPRSRVSTGPDQLQHQLGRVYGWVRYWRSNMKR